MIVMTNGCMDGGLHLGHLRLLRYCRQLAGPGGTVVVALNSDDSVRRLKGPTRPIVPYCDRAESLMELWSVSHVVPFDTEDNLLKLLAHYHPHYLIKGPPAKEFPQSKIDLLAQWGGQCIRLDKLANYSTTQLCEATKGGCTG